jgi:hypothetical protein
MLRTTKAMASTVHSLASAEKNGDAVQVRGALSLQDKRRRAGALSLAALSSRVSHLVTTDSAMDHNLLTSSLRRSCKELSIMLPEDGGGPGVE